jgi:hypothetical protein
LAMLLLLHLWTMIASMELRKLRTNTVELVELRKLHINNTSQFRHNSGTLDHFNLQHKQCLCSRLLQSGLFKQQLALPSLCSLQQSQKRLRHLQTQVQVTLPLKLSTLLRKTGQTRCSAQQVEAAEAADPQDHHQEAEATVATTMTIKDHLKVAMQTARNHPKVALLPEIRTTMMMKAMILSLLDLQADLHLLQVRLLTLLTTAGQAASVI